MSDITDKYYDIDTSIGSRTARNSELYKEITKAEIENFDVKSNATVLGNNKDNIDVEKIKSILDTHYNDAPKRRSIKIEDMPYTGEITPIIETKEYDINVILDKAKEEKKVDYKEDRAKRLRNTQFDILNNLDIDPKDYVEDYDEEDQETEDLKTSAQELEELINTITLNEKEQEEKDLDDTDDYTDEFTDSFTDDIKEAIKEQEEKTEDITEINEITEEKEEKKNLDDTPTDPLEMFSDLKGSENTVILRGLSEKAEKMIEDMEQSTSLDSSFFTKSSTFKKKDFEDYEDFADVQDKGVKPIFKIIIAILIIAFIAGIVILVKSLI